MHAAQGSPSEGERTRSEGRRLTVALLCGAPLHRGGVEAHLRSLLAQGDKKRYRFVLIAPTSQEFAEEILALGGEVWHWVPQHARDWRAALRLYRLLRSESVDLLHIHDPRGGLLGRIIAKCLGIPVLYTAHLLPYQYAGAGRRASRWTPFQRWIYKRVEAQLNHHFTERVLYVSSCAYQEALQEGIAPQGRAEVIENGVDLARYSDPGDASLIRDRFKVAPDVPVICFVGRLTEQKGPDLLIKAASQLRDRSRDFQLWLVGDGPLQTALESHVRKLGLEGVVRFLGYRKDVPELLAASDLFVLPSRYEAMSISLLEAMAAGKPCVVTDVGDNARLIEQGSEGLVVPPEDETALAAALQRLLSDPSLRRAMGAAARQKARCYEVATMVQRIQAVYAEVSVQARAAA